MIDSSADTALYGYAVVGPVSDELREELGDGLELIGTDELAVVVGSVPLSDFGEDVLEKRLNDREWLAETATAHEAVVHRLLACTTVAPLRFGSLHRNAASVESFLEAHDAEFRSTLERLRGRVEFGVKVWLEPRERSEPRPAATSGRGYLEQLRRDRDSAATAQEDLDERLTRIHETLLRAGVAGRVNRPQPRELTGATAEMVLNAVYLVPAGDDALFSEVQRLKEQHPDLEFELTGPWAPYNFVEEPEQ
jgi:hypothetical protein